MFESKLKNKVKLDLKSQKNQKTGTRFVKNQWLLSVYFNLNSHGLNFQKPFKIFLAYSNVKNFISGLPLFESKKKLSE